MALPVGSTIKLNNSISTGSAPGQSQYSAPAGSQAKIIGTRTVNGQTYYNIDQTAYGGGTGWTLASSLEGAASPSSSSNQSSSSQPTSPLQAVNNAIQDTYKNLQAEVTSKFGQYQASNPFVFDQVLADKTKQAKEQIDPYYNETLTNYLTGVDRKISRSSQDTKDLLSELTADTNSYTQDAKDKLTNAVEQAGKGFADAGLFDSGDRLRTEGKLGAETSNNLTDYLRKQDYQQNQIQTGQQRNIEDVNLNKSVDVRNIERQRATDTSTLASQLTKEQGQKYVTGFNATLSPELQASSGSTDLLKNIGIY